MADDKLEQDIGRVLGKVSEDEVAVTDGLHSLTGRQSMDNPLVEISELVNNWVRVGDMAILAGHGGVGKSLIAKHMTCALCGGVDFLGYHVQEAQPTLSLDLEMGEFEFRTRLNMLLPQYPEVARDNFHWVCLSNFTIKNRRNYARLRNELALVRPKLLVVDNHASFHGGDENSNSEMMANVILPLRDLMAEFGLGILYVMHTAWADKARPRGATAIFDAASTVVMVEAPQADTRKLTWTKRRSVRTEMGPKEIEISYNAANYAIFPSAGAAVNDILNQLEYPAKRAALAHAIADGLSITPSGAYKRISALVEAGKLVERDDKLFERGLPRLADIIHR